MKSLFWNVPDKASCNIIKIYGQEAFNSIDIKEFQLIPEGEQKNKHIFAQHKNQQSL